ncbi:MAG: hypothetical protein WB439_16010 [Acidobacteriaceae bacterium]
MIESGPPHDGSPARPVPSLQPHSFAYPAAPPAELKPIARWMWISGAAFVILLGLLAIPVYRSVRTQMRLGSTTVTSIHVAMGKGDDAAIFNDADVAYQQQVGRKKSDELFSWVRSSLGQPHASTRIGTYASTSTKDGTVLTLNYETTFDKGAGTETFKLHKVGANYLLLGYTVHSPQLKQQDVPQDLRTN